MRNILLKSWKLSLLILTLLLLPGCGGAGQRYMFSLNSAYIYDAHTSLFISSSQEFKYSDKTFFNIKNTNPVYQKGTVKDYSIPADYTNSGSEIKFTVSYIIEDGKLCIAPPLLDNKTFMAAYVLPDEKSAVFVFNHSDVFVIDVTEDKITPVFESVLPEESGLVWADIISISPDGQYLLYKSNRNNLSSDIKSFDLFVKNLVSGEDNLIMNFDKKEFITWSEEEDESFLYREDVTESGVSVKKYSEIFTYSFATNKSKVFWNMKDKFRGYEIIDDTYFYIHAGRVLDIVNYYNKDLIFIDTGMYSKLNDLKLSPDGAYAVMYGMHTNIDGKLITEVISIHLETNNTISHTEDSVRSYIVDSYDFGKRNDGTNIMVINYFDTSTLKYKSEFYTITHKHIVPDFKKNLGNADSDE